MNTLSLEKYARLLVKTGINIQENQILVVNAPIECAGFARKIAEIAFQEGARDVVIRWIDEQFAKLRYMNAPDDVFDEYPEWQKEFFLSYAKKGAAFLSIVASDPDLMKDVNPDRIMRSQKIAAISTKEYKSRLMKDQNVWCVASIPTEAWAKRVFPDLATADAVERLWEAIFSTVRADKDDPVAEWDAHKNKLKKNMEYLNNNQFQYLRYRNAIGTDVVVELPDNHVWAGGSSVAENGVEFIANLPTEEIFTMPKKTGVNGTIAASKPLNFNGNLIENFTLTLKDGKIVDIKAEKGYDLLKGLLETDEGASYLGEVALVPYDSPISNSKILFYNTLFDENASCHFAFGEAYPGCVKNGNALGKEELAAAGANQSLIHVDFMIGTSDLEIIGIRKDGSEVPVFKNGNFAI